METSKGFFRRLFSWRGILFLLAAFVTLVVLLLAEENWRGSRAWRHYKAEMEAKGERFDAARLIPPTVPASQNLAEIPFFTNDGADVSPFNEIKWPERRHPLPSTWSYAQADELIAWASAFDVPASDSMTAATNVIEYLNRHDPVFHELESAGERPFFRFNVSYEYWGRPEGEMLPQLARTKGLIRILAMRAEAEMVCGETDKAMDDIHLLFRLDGGLKDEPLLISELVRIAGLAITFEPIGEGLAEHRWSDAQLVDLQEHLQKIDVMSSVVRSMYGERDICFNQNYDMEDFARREGVSNAWNLFPRGWFRLEQINVNRGFSEFVFPQFDEAKHIISPSVNHSVEGSFQQQVKAKNWFLTAFVDHSIFETILLPAFAHVPLITALTQSEVDNVFVACALERCRLAKGRYPETLDALVPRFAASLPHDIINGQPLKYRLTGDGRFVLYSVGWNEKDDGGVVARKGKNPDAEHGDWVWAYPKGN